MEDLPVTLDDGELWIPSDIFRPEELHHHHHHHHNRSIPDAAASLEDLNLRFCRLNSDNDFVFSPNLSSLSQRLGGYIRAMAQYSVANPNPNPNPNRFCEVAFGPNEIDRGLFFNNDSGFVHHTPCPRALPFPMHTPAVYPQVAEQLMETRIGRSHRPAYNRQQHNRILQSQASGCRCGFGVGVGFGLTRGCCSSLGSSLSSTSSGTGVFIPRTNFGTFEGCKSKPGVRSKIPPRKLRTRKADDYHYHRSLPSPEVVLPKEWTY